MSFMPVLNEDGTMIRAEVDGVHGYLFLNSEDGTHILCSDDSELVQNLLSNISVSNDTVQNPNASASVSEPDTSATNLKEGVTHWLDDSAVKHLIELWHKHESDFQSTTIRNDAVWNKIADELQDINSKWNYTPLQCTNKFKYHRKEYNKTKDHNRQTGNAPKTCKFFEEFDEIFGDKPCVKPVSLASSSTKRPFPDTENSASKVGNECGSDSNSNPDSPDCEKNSASTRNKKKTRVQRELQDWAETFRADAQKREEARQKRHEEGLAAYKEIMGKLIEKLG
ncbi:Zinc finger and SCAN domain-containing protein 29 [Frankliniella fusca]|uniref:Zinc finger and SCAN domain-containing protein 29 n=1 Tax=Frankliniella fusca TaxID=407009 RepID=A0AAE1LV11_9NEOP|nr:Zinc finger and SCAN domain-containing protein 29 [Frankliniella fusca]